MTSEATKQNVYLPLINSYKSDLFTSQNFQHQQWKVLFFIVLNARALFFLNRGEVYSIIGITFRGFFLCIPRQKP